MSPKIFNFKTYKDGAALYGSVFKYRQALKAMEKINEDVNKMLVKRERGIDGRYLDGGPVK